MTTSWLIVLGEFAVFFTCAYWYFHRSRERSFAVRVEHDSIEGMTLGKVGELIRRHFTVSEILAADSAKNVMNPADSTVLHQGDHLLIKARPEEREAIIAFLGQLDNMQWI